MKFSITVAIFAAFAAVSAPYVSAQVSSPSSQGSNEPSSAPTTFGTIAPSFAGTAVATIFATSAATFAETGAETPAETGAETLAETIVETQVETSAETSAETNAETSAETNAETSAETSGDSAVAADSSLCSAYPVCAALNLTGDCCPTNEDVFLDCCSGIPAVAVPGLPASSLAPSSSPVTPAPSSLPPSTLAPTTLPVTPSPSSLPPSTLAPTTLPVTPSPSSPPPSTLAPTASPVTPAPSSLPPSTLAPTASPVTPAPSSLPPSISTTVLLSIKSLADGGGCMEASSTQVYLIGCDTDKLTQKFNYDGTHIRTGSDDNMCLQASYNPPAEEGEWVRVTDCDSSNSLQKFVWDKLGAISVADSPALCLTFRGVNDNVNSDYIRLTKCSMTDYGLDLGWKGVA